MKKLVVFLLVLIAKLFNATANTALKLGQKINGRH